MRYGRLVLEHQPGRGRGPISNLTIASDPAFVKLQWENWFMKPARKRCGRKGGRWISKMTVWHVRARRFIRRRDGKPFRFLIG